MPENSYFLIHYDDGMRNMDTDGQDPNGAVAYLKSEGFKCTAGYWGCPWYFVDINEKIFKPGRPGVSYGKIIGDHSITLAEFKSIYEIYKKHQD